jgi:hypothetical protein
MHVGVQKECALLTHRKRQNLIVGVGQYQLAPERSWTVVVVSDAAVFLGAVQRTNLVCALASAWADQSLYVASVSSSYAAYGRFTDGR